MISHEDVKKFGIIPELVGRLPIIAPLQVLEIEDLKKIISEPKNAILKQYKLMFEMDNIDLEFNDEAIEEIAKKAYDQKTGARGIRSIIENIMLEIMYDVPSQEDVAKCIITKDVVQGTGEPVIVKKEAI